MKNLPAVWTLVDGGDEAVEGNLFQAHFILFPQRVLCILEYFPDVCAFTTNCSLPLDPLFRFFFLLACLQCLSECRFSDLHSILFRVALLTYLTFIV